MVSAQIDKGWLIKAERISSPHFNNRPADTQLSLLVIHNISLPPGQFGGSYITDLFLGKLDPSGDPFFEEIYQLEVSAHCLIRRDGHVIQYVSFDDRAWHAGVSEYKGCDNCNNFSIGIELEGTDTQPYTEAQYQKLAEVTDAIYAHYPEIKGNIAGHSDIAPGRKTDPGKSFNWTHYLSKLTNNKKHKN